MSDARLAALDALVHELEGLLSALDEPEGDLSRAWERCQAGFGRWRSLQLADASPLSPRARARLQDAQRLHAIASSNAERVRAGLRAELEQVRRSRRKLRAAQVSGERAHACDREG
jgi:hypothetical protein